MLEIDVTRDCPYILYRVPCTVYHTPYTVHCSSITNHYFIIHRHHSLITIHRESSGFAPPGQMMRSGNPRDETDSHKEDKEKPFVKKLAPYLFAAIVAILGLSISPLYVTRYPTSYQDRVAVLMYHHISDQAKSSNTIPSRLFRDQLTLLQRKGYRFISLEQFRSYLSGAPVPDKAVLVTFDDGYESFYTDAYPTLKEFNIPAVNFVITRDLEMNKPGYITHLTKEEIREMVLDPIPFDFQCHTDNLHRQTAEKPSHSFLTGPRIINGVKQSMADYDRQVLEDTAACTGKLSELYDGQQIFYAYPYGAHNDHLIDLLRQSGIQYAFTVRQGLADRNSLPMAIPRINAGSPKITPESLLDVIRQNM